MELAQKHKDQLERIKNNVKKSYDYFRDNYDRWYKFKKFLYVTALTTQDLKVLKDLDKPMIEFNILEAYVSRQKGEFSKQIPSLYVSKGQNNEQVDEQTLDVVDGHMQYVEKEFARTYANKIYDDMLSGGFSVAKVYTDYENDMSFDQIIKSKRSFDPTLCGFDPICEESHKGDGNYCFEIVPYSEEEFKVMFPDIDTTSFKYSTDFSSFNWSYKNNKERIILVCFYYEKVKKRIKIVKLSDRQTMTEKQYEDFLIDWEEKANIEQAPQVVKERMTELTEITRYKLVENDVLSYKKTDFKYLPLVFFDGNSTEIRETLHGELKQVTRPYCYQAKGVQQLKNLCGQTLANEVETMVQHKFMVPIEAIPEQYKDAYIEPQKSQVMVYNLFKDNDPNIRLDPPRAVPRVPTPPEVINGFTGADQATQVILGMYDATLGVNEKQISGVAIQEGATQSNATAMNYINGYLAGWQQIGKIYLDLIPKYYATPRSVPIVTKDGKKAFQMVNDAGQPSLKYSSDALNIEVTPGVNFSVQRTKNLQQISSLMQASPILQQFFGTTPEGLKFILDNLDVSTADQLKEAVDKFIPQYQKEQAQESQNNPMQGRLQAEQAKLTQKEQQDQRNNQIELAKVAVQDKTADTGRINALAGIGQGESKLEMEKNKTDAENARTLVDKAVKVADMVHKHNKEKAEFVHNTTKGD